MIRTLIYIAIMTYGVALGSGITSFFKKEKIENTENIETRIWTCPTHSHMRQKEAGLCSICKLELQNIPSIP